MSNSSELSSTPEQEGPTYKDIVDAQTQYYETHKKNTFFKKSQKFECAESVCSQIPLEHLINQTCWIIPDENKLVFDYRTFKLFANPSNYDVIVDNIVRFCVWCVSQYGSFEFYFNLDTFSVSGAERYRDVVILFCNECFRRNTKFSNSVVSVNFYNMPNVIDQISHMLLPIIPPEIRPKIRVFPRNEPDTMLADLYAKSGKTYIHTKET